jgi:hypothetical protein
VFVGEFEVDGAGAEHGDGEGGVGGVEPVGAADDEADFGGEALDASVADAVLDRVEDHVAAQTYRLGALDERGEPRSLRPATPPVQQHGSLVAGEVGRRDNLGIGVDGSPVRRSAGMVTDESGLAAVVSGIV